MKKESVDHFGEQKSNRNITRSGNAKIPEESETRVSDLQPKDREQPAEKRRTSKLDLINENEEIGKKAHQKRLEETRNREEELFLLNDDPKAEAPPANDAENVFAFAKRGSSAKQDSDRLFSSNVEKNVNKSGLAGRRTDLGVFHHQKLDQETSFDGGKDLKKLSSLGQPEAEDERQDKLSGSMINKKEKEADKKAVKPRGKSRNVFESDGYNIEDVLESENNLKRVKKPAPQKPKVGSELSSLLVDDEQSPLFSKRLDKKDHFKTEGSLPRETPIQDQPDQQKVPDEAEQHVKEKDPTQLKENSKLADAKPLQADPAAIQLAKSDNPTMKSPLKKQGVSKNEEDLLVGDDDLLISKQNTARKEPAVQREDPSPKPRNTPKPP